ncbi:MAG: adenosylcobinamide-phosphate synthase CbiB [Dehalococcoidia bacterium]
MAPAAKEPRVQRAAVFLLACGADAIGGDPPTAVHPVGWLGRLVRSLEQRAPDDARGRRRFGVAVAATLPLAAAAGWAVLARRPRAGAVAIARDAVVLDTTFALRTLLARAGEVRRALERDDLDEARRLLAWHLVSRDTGALSAAEVAGATIESVAENLGDSVVGPWLAYALAGVPGALAYRVVNTLDTMWGYRSPAYAALGAGPARLDDLASWAPARVTAAALCAAAAVTRADARGALRAWRRDHAETESPNAGHPMSAMAGALGVTLEKRGAYRLGDGREPVAADIRAAVRLARVAACLVAATVVAATVPASG